MHNKNWPESNAGIRGQHSDATPPMAPSLSSGSHGSISSSAMDANDQTVIMYSYDRSEAIAEADPNWIPNENYHGYTAQEQGLYDPTSWEFQENTLLEEPESELGCRQVLTDTELKAESSDMPVDVSRSHPSQPRMNYQRGKNSKNRQGQHGAQKRKCKCTFDGCDKKFTRTADRQRHEKYVHLDGRSKQNIVCDYPECSRHRLPFSRKDHYREHLRDFHFEDITKRGVNVHQAAALPKNEAFAASSGKRKAVKIERLESGSSRGYWPGQTDKYAIENGYSNVDSPAYDDMIVGPPDFPYDVSGEGFAGSAADEKDDEKAAEEKRLRSCRGDLTWWRCSRCLKRVSRKEDEPELDWTCDNPDCMVSIEKIRRTIREEAAMAVAYQDTYDVDEKPWGEDVAEQDVFDESYV